MSLARTAARGAMVTLGAQWAKFVIQLAALVVLARLLSPSDYGLLAMAAVFIGIAGLIADFGLSQASIQAQDITQGQKSSLFWLSTALGLLLCGAALLLAAPIADFFGHPEILPIVQVLALLYFVTSASGQFRAEASRQLKFRQMGAADVIAQLLSSILAIVMAVLGAGFWALVYQQIAYLVVQTILLVIIARWRPSWPRRREPIRHLVVFGANNLGTKLVTYISENADSALLGKFGTVHELGIYSRAYQIFKIPLQQLAAPLTRVAFPILSKLNGTPEYDSFIQRGQLLLTYSLGGLFFIAVGVASPFIEIMLGDKWSSAKGIFALLAIGGVFQAMGYIYYWIFLSKALTGLQLKWSVIARSFMVAFMAVGVIWGALGVAAGLALGLALNWALLTFFAIPKTGVALRPLLAAAARPVAVYSAMLALAAPMIFWSSTWDSVLLEFGANLGTMLLVLFVIVILTPRLRKDARLVVQSFRLLGRRRPSVAPEA